MPDNTTDLSAIYSGNASIYCVYITFEIPHIDAHFTSIRETFRETFQVIHNLFQVIHRVIHIISGFIHIYICFM